MLGFIHEFSEQDMSHSHQGSWHYYGGGTMTVKLGVGSATIGHTGPGAVANRASSSCRLSPNRPVDLGFEPLTALGGRRFTYMTTARCNQS